MKLNKNVFILALVAACLCTVSTFRLIPVASDENETKLPFFNSNRPRIISIFSKPPEPDAPKLTGPNILGHLGNVVHGGSIGLEVKPIGGIRGFLGHAKKFKPGGESRPQIGHPENQKPPPERYEPPKGGTVEEDKDEKDWIPENPKKPVTGGPSWEDIGEDPDDVPSIPYEDIINPRVKPQGRPKRSFVNSKIYHVPLTVKFSSNGRPCVIKFNSEIKDPDFDKHKKRLLYKNCKVQSAISNQ